MKISKLFHWLYALLMLLPAFFVGGRMAYTIFNKNAYESYSGETKEYILTPIHSRNDLVINQTYYFTSTNYNNISGVDFSSSSYKIFCTNVIFNYIEPNHTILNNQNEINSFSQYKVLNENAYYTGFYDSNGNNLATIYSNNNKFEFSFVFKSTNIINDFRFTDTAFYQKTILNNNYFLDNAFDYSMSQLNELPLFSWAKDSFIVQPFTYITGLFGMPSDSPVLTLLSYWCSISLIWLTFDLLMYVPLLVHRWLDKGVLE